MPTLVLQPVGKLAHAPVPKLYVIVSLCVLLIVGKLSPKVHESKYILFVTTLGTCASDCKTTVDQSPVAIVSVAVPAVALAVALQVHKYCAVPVGTVLVHPSFIAEPVSAPVLNVNVEFPVGFAGAELLAVLLYICTFAV